MGTWLNRNESLAEDNLQNYTFSKVFCHFWLVSTIFSSFSSIFECFAAIHLQCLPIGRTVWQSRLAWQNRIGELGPPDRKKFWQEGIEFWQDGMVGPPLKMTQLRLCSGISRCVCCVDNYNR